MLPLFVKGRFPRGKGKTFKDFLSYYGCSFCEGAVIDKELEKAHRTISGFLNRKTILYKDGQVSRSYLRSLRKCARQTKRRDFSWFEYFRKGLFPETPGFEYSPWLPMVRELLPLVVEKLNPVLKVDAEASRAKPKHHPGILRTAKHLGINLDDTPEVLWSVNQPRARGGIIKVADLPDDVRVSQALVANEPTYVLKQRDKFDTLRSTGGGLCEIPDTSEFKNLPEEELNFRSFRDTLRIREQERKVKFQKNLDLYLEGGGFASYINMCIPEEDLCLYLAEKGAFARFDEHEDSELSKFEISEFTLRTSGSKCEQRVRSALEKS